MTSIDLFPRCPSCDALLDDSRSLKDRMHKPTPDSFSICAYCAAVLRFNEDLSLRTTTSADLDELDPETRSLVERAAARIKLMPLPTPARRRLRD